MEDLRIRFEPPNDNNRWDNPLFKVKVLQPPVITSEVSIAEEKKDSTEVKAPAVEQKQKKSSWKPKKKASTEESSTITESNISSAPCESKDSSSTPLVEDVKALTISGSVVTSSDNLADFEDYLTSFDKI